MSTPVQTRPSGLADLFAANPLGMPAPAVHPLQAPLLQPNDELQQQIQLLGDILNRDSPLARARQEIQFQNSPDMAPIYQGQNAADVYRTYRAVRPTPQELNPTLGGLLMQLFGGGR